jgi:hypothetical protein
MTRTGSDSWRSWAERKAVIHRPLNHEELSLAPIDDVVARGKRKD